MNNILICKFACRSHETGFPILGFMTIPCHKLRAQSWELLCWIHLILILISTVALCKIKLISWFLIKPLFSHWSNAKFAGFWLALPFPETKLFTGYWIKIILLCRLTKDRNQSLISISTIQEFPSLKYFYFVYNIC